MAHTTTTTTNDTISSTLTRAIHTLSQSQQAALLYDIAAKQINAGVYDAQIDGYLDVYLKAPGLSKEDTARALLTRAKARKMAGERAILMANQDFKALERLDPTNGDLQSHLRSLTSVPPPTPYGPPYQRTPPEIWERIALFIPRYHLRTWLFLSHLHHSIAIRHIFHTVDIYFGSDDQDNLNRGLDFFDRVKADSIFASHVKSLRLHWAFEEGDMLDLMIRIFKGALPDFKRLREFEWIGYPELKPDVVKAILGTHSHLRSLGLMGWHFDASGIPAFTNLHKFTLRAEDDDGYADMSELRQTLDANTDSLTHLILGAYLARDHSWDTAFQSHAIHNLTHLDLVDTRISHFVLVRISQARSLVSLTLHGTLADPISAGIIFKSDYSINGEHTFLPLLHSFRFIVIGHDSDVELYRSIAHFLSSRKKLRKLDLGNCPCSVLEGLLPGLKGLRVLGARVDKVEGVERLVAALPVQMSAIHLSVAVCDKTLSTYARHLTRFPSLSFLHMESSSLHRPKPNLMDEPHFKDESEAWYNSALSLAKQIPSLDFVGWHGEHYVVVRKSVSIGCSTSLSVGLGCSSGKEGCEKEKEKVELKELPSRRQLDCCKGVDLGTEDAMWLERKDVPIDYEMST